MKQRTRYVSNRRLETTIRQGKTISKQYLNRQPIIVVARSKASTVFARSNAGFVGSNPTQGMDVVCVYSVFVLFCV
jgi:hypothetical protein